MPELTKNQHTVVNNLPNTSHELAAILDRSVSYIYDIIEDLRQKGYTIEQDTEGRYYIPNEHDVQEGPTDAPVEARMDSDSKGKITREVKKYLSELEYALKETLEDTEPAAADWQSDPGTEDIIIHRTDDHFGEKNTNQHGDVTFNSEIAEQRVRHIFDETLAEVEQRRSAGTEFDAAHLLMGGDIITGEAIYDGQAHEIDETLHEQIDRAADVYMESIRRLSNHFDNVQVVCQPGNHGRLNSGSPTNADSILYMALDKMVRESEMDNVRFMQSHKSYYVDFQIRDWNVHLRHGHDKSLEHIGTSAGKQRWLSWLVDHEFDVAFRGHYHMLKEEPINGRPVIMGGSILPQTEFEESMALSGRAMAGVHGVSDDYPIEWTSRIHFD